MDRFKDIIGKITYKWLKNGLLRFRVIWVESSNKC